MSGSLPWRLQLLPPACKRIQGLGLKGQSDLPTRALWHTSANKIEEFCRCSCAIESVLYLFRWLGCSLKVYALVVC
jgi:hypothetical protein